MDMRFPSLCIASVSFLISTTSVAAQHSVASPMLLSQSSALYGSVLFSDGDMTKGLYTIPTSASSSMSLLYPNVKALAAIIRDGQYVAAYPAEYFDAARVEVYDMLTGTKTDSFSSEDRQFDIYGMDEDPESGEIYAVCHDSSGRNYELVTLSFQGATPNRTRTVGTLTAADYWYGFAIDAQGQLWGVASDGDIASLYKINKNTAAMTRVGSTGVEAYYETSACFDRESGILYWSVADYDDRGYLAKVNLTTGAATKVYQFPNEERIGGLAMQRVTAAAAAPAKCENVCAVFESGNLSGHIDLRAPALLQDGSIGQGKLDIIVAAGNREVGRCQGVWGALASVPVTVEERGKYNFTVFASNPAGNSENVIVNNVFVGPDNPKAPQPVLSRNAEVMTLTWPEVSEGDNGGWIDPSNITYMVTRMPENLTVATGISVCEFSENLSEPDMAQEVYYEVTAQFGEYSSTPGASNALWLGAFRPPYAADFALDGLSGFSVIDANHDNITWKNQDDEVNIDFNRVLDMDDWLITPALNLEAGKSYTLSFKAHSHGPGFPEALEVKLGSYSSEESMDRTLIPRTEIVSSDWSEYEVIIVAKQSGKHYIGFHGLSDADAHILHLKDLTVGQGVVAAIPEAPSDLSIVAAEDYSLSAAVSVKAPERDIYDQPVAEMTKLEIFRNGVSVKVFDNPVAGCNYTFEDTVDVLGEYNYSATATNEYGISESAITTAYIGAPLPGAVMHTAARRTQDEGEVLVSWTPVSEDINGKPLYPGSVHYVLAMLDEEGFYPVTDLMENTSCTYQAAEPGEQKVLQVAVFAVTDAGTGQGKYAPAIAAGTPYEYIHETVSAGMFDHLWIADETDGGHWGITEDSTTATSPDGDGFMISMHADGMNASGHLVSGLVTINAAGSQKISFQVYNPSTADNGANVNEISVGVCADGDSEFTELYRRPIQQVASRTSWGKVEVDLSQWAQQTIQVRIGVTVKQYATTLFDDIWVGSKPGGVDMMSDSECNAQIRINGRTINVDCGDAVAVTLIDASGTVIYTSKSTHHTMAVQQDGIYMLRIGNIWKKIIL